MKPYTLLVKASLTFLICIVLNTPGYTQWLWARNAYAAGDVIPAGAACDAAGNVYITGSVYSGTFTFGSYTLSSASFSTTPAYHFYLTKYDSSGNVLWARNDSLGKAEGLAVATDRWGNVYIAGDFMDTCLYLGNTVLHHPDTAASHIFIAKYSAGGNLLWARAVNEDDNTVSAIATDTAGNLFVCGFYSSSTIIFGNDTLRLPKNTNAGGTDIFIAKYDSSGSALWAKDFHGAGNAIDWLRACTTDRQGNLIIGGYFGDSTMVFGSTTLVNPFGRGLAVYTAKLDNNGTPIWARTANASGSASLGAWVNSLTTDTNNNIYACGVFYDNLINFGLDTLVHCATIHNLDGNMFLVKYDANGSPVWDRMAANDYDARAWNLAADAYGHIYVEGFWGPGNLKLGSFNLYDTSTSTDRARYADMFFAKYDTGGNVLWTTSIGGNYSVYPDELCTSGDKVYVFGSSASADLKFGPIDLVNGNWRNVFLAKLDGNLDAANLVPLSYSQTGAFLYPNPNTGNFRLHTTTTAREVSVTICDVMGRIVKQFVAPGNTEIDIELNAPDGMYFLTAAAEDMRTCTKFVIEK